MTENPPEFIELPDESNDDSYSLDWNGFFDEAEHLKSPLPIKSTEDPEYVDFGPPIIQPLIPGRTPAASSAPKGSYKPFGAKPSTSGNDDETSEENEPPPPLTKCLDVGVALTTKPPQRVFSLPCLRAGTVGGLISQGGAGKSMLAMQLSLMLASGVDTFRGLASHTGWQNLMGGPVLYASFEDGEDDAAYRLHNIWASLGSVADANALAAAKQNLTVETLTGARLPDLLNPDWGKWLTDACNDRLLVIIDTLRTSHMADENDSAAMSRLLATMQSSVIQNKQCAILFLHHASKSGSAKDQRDKQQAARGSSVITDNARGQYFLNGITAEDVDPNQGMIFDPYAPGELAEIPLHETEPNNGSELFRRYARFGVAKSNYAAPWPTALLRRDDRGVLSYVPGFQSAPSRVKSSPTATSTKQQKPKPTRGNIQI